MLDSQLIGEAESVPSADKEESECSVCGEYLYRESLGCWEDDKGYIHEDCSPWMDECDRDKLDAGMTPDGKLVCSTKCRSQAMYETCDNRDALPRLLGLLREAQTCIDKVRDHLQRWEGSSSLDELEDAMRSAKRTLGEPDMPQWTKGQPLVERARCDRLQSTIHKATCDLKWTPLSRAQVALQINMQLHPEDNWSIGQNARSIASLGRILLDMQAALDQKD